MEKKVEIPQDLVEQWALDYAVEHYGYSRDDLREFDSRKIDAWCSMDDFKAGVQQVIDYLNKNNLVTK